MRADAVWGEDGRVAGNFAEVNRVLSRKPETM